jgi:hypothetical protein
VSLAFVALAVIEMMGSLMMVMCSRLVVSRGGVMVITRSV